MTALDRLLAECDHDDGHAACPDNWAGCNRARTSLPKLARIVRVLLVALKTAELGTEVYRKTTGLEFDHGANAWGALAEAEKIAGEP